MYVCNDCGYVFENFDIIEENRGEYWGVSCTETIYACPNCKGSFSEAKQCKKCGYFEADNNLYEGICLKCIEECKNDFDVCYSISKNDLKQKIKINPLILSLFGDEEEIENVLVDYIKKQMSVDCSEYINEDISWFAEQLEKEVKKK